MSWSWMLPESVSVIGQEIDRIYYIILWITGTIFVLTEGALIVFLVRYRHREGRRAEYSHGNLKAEIVWTVIPFLLVVYIAAASADVWRRAKTRDPNAPEVAGAVAMRVTAKQFEWNITYPGADGELDTADDFVVRNQLHMPVNRPIRIELMSEDVIHSFFLPAMRVKQDAVPGMVIPVWVEATETGVYPLACAELCGLGHYSMDGTVTVHTAAEFDAWQAAAGASASAATEDAEVESVEGEPDDEDSSDGEERV